LSAFGWAGVYLLVVCSVVVVGELAYVSFRLARVRRRWRVLQQVLATDGAGVAGELARLDGFATERRLLLGPYATLARNPLVRVLLGVYQRR
jgi:hypothetical protein